MSATTTPHGVSLHYDTFGDPHHPAMVLIQGLGAQMVGWREELCRMLACHGFHVIRFDNRDVGLSQRFAAGGYTLADMATDTVGLLDALHIDAAHVVGQSMGGMIAQHVALDHPGRVLSLAIVYSTPSTAFLHGRDLLTGRLDAPRPRNRSESAELFVRNEAASASPGYPRDLVWLHDLGGVMHDRGHDPDGVRRHTEALLNAEDLTPRLGQISTPTTILHGADDVLIDSAAAATLHNLIGNSTLAIYPGMGHELPRPLWTAITDQICRNARPGAAHRELGRSDAAG